MIAYSTALRNALMTTAADGGLPFAELFRDATLTVYTGAQPADPDAAATGSVLLTISGISFTPSDTGSITRPPGDTWSGIVAADGEAGWFRLTADTGQSLDGSVGSGEDLQFLSTAWTTGQTKTIDSFTVTMPVSATAQSGTEGGGQLLAPSDDTIAISVGTGGDFSTLSAAINHLSQYRPYGVKNESGAGKIYGTITILTGFAMEEPLVFGSGTDLSWIHIFGRYSFANSYETIPFESTDLGANLTVIRVDQGARAPYFNNCVFEQTAGVSAAWAFKVYDGSVLQMYMSGAKNCKGLYMSSSKAILSSCSLLDCDGETITCMHGSELNIYSSSITDSLGAPALWASQGARVAILDTYMTGAQSNTIFAELGATVSLSGDTDCRKDGATQTSGDIVVSDGGIVIVDGDALGGYSQTENVITPDGLIIGPTRV